MSRLYIGNLPFTFKNEDLAKFVNDNNVKAQTSTISTRGERSLGFGFVVLSSNDADVTAKAIEALNGKDAGGRQLKAEVARPEGEKAPRAPRGPRAHDDHPRTRAPRIDRPHIEAPASGITLHVGNLPFAATDDDLKNIFDGFTLKSAKIITRHDGKSKGFGFVEFSNEAEAKKAKDAVEGTQVESRTIKLEFARPLQPRAPRAPRAEGDRPRIVRAPRTGAPATSAAASSAPRAPRAPREPRAPRAPRVPIEQRVKSSATIHIGNLSFQATEEDVKVALTALKLTAKTIKIVTRHNGQSRGYAFVDFENADAAKAAIALNDTEIKARKVKVDIAFVPVAPQTAAVAETKQQPSAGFETAANISGLP